MGTSFQGEILIRKGKIVNIQRNKGFVKIITENRIFQFDNAYALPGFSDSHGHVAALGTKLNGLDLSQCKVQKNVLKLP